MCWFYRNQGYANTGTATLPVPAMVNGGTSVFQSHLSFLGLSQTHFITRFLASAARANYRCSAPPSSRAGRSGATGSYRSPSNPGCPFPLQKSRLTLTNDKDPKWHKCFKTKHLHTLAETSPHQHGKAHCYRVCLRRNIVCSHLLVKNTNHRKLTSFWSQQMGWERALTWSHTSSSHCCHLKRSLVSRLLCTDRMGSRVSPVTRLEHKCNTTWDAALPCATSENLKAKQEPVPKYFQDPFAFAGFYKTPSPQQYFSHAVLFLPRSPQPQLSAKWLEHAVYFFPLNNPLIFI